MVDCLSEYLALHQEDAREAAKDEQERIQTIMKVIVLVILLFCS